MLKHCCLALMLIALSAPPARAGWFFGPAQAMPAAFGIAESHGSDLHVFYKWEDVVARMDADGTVPQVFADHPEFAQLDFLQQVTAVNNLVNKYPDVSDENNWGKSDYWEIPSEFFARGGDCEDYAIAKYAWLRYLGVPEDRLRVAMVYDRLKETEHMLLVVYTEDGQPLYLDSQIRAIRTHNDFKRYWPLYSVNRDGWWIVNPRGKGRQIVQSLLAEASSSAH